MDDNEKRKLHKRTYIFAYITLLVFSLLAIRLFWISFTKGDEYSTAASNQRKKEIRLSIPRGYIYDRNLIPLTNRKKEMTMFIFSKVMIKDNEKALEYIENNTDLSRIEIEKLLNSSEGILEIPIKKEDISLEESIPGILVAEKVNRYDENNILSHVIGYVHRSNYTGESGIEKAYEDVLKLEDETHLISYIADGKQRPIPGDEIVHVVKNRSGKVSNVKLTIDYHIQKIVEQAIDSESRMGAVVVAEVETGDIVAMVSRPNFDQNDVSQYLKSENMNLYNKAINVTYPPGSIFKIVVLLSALENNLVELDEKFFCNGYEEVMGNTFDCNKADGHGEQTLKEAFANSCNSVFIQLGQRLGGKKIMETAKKLGFEKDINIGPVGLKRNPGSLPEGNDLLGPVIGLISIGQSKIEVTPLQVTNMMMILANRGIQKDLAIIEGIATDEGIITNPWRKGEDERIVSTLNSIIIQDFMEEVISSGTGRGLRLDSVGGGAGKTGSAQAGVNNEIVHGWFSGYFPKEDPRYVITVFVEEGGSGGKSAGPIFEKIAKGITNLGK